MSIRLTLPVGAAAEITEAIRLKKLSLPGRELLRQVTYKMDLLLMLWEREQASSNDACRFMLADSSPQHGFNYFALIEDSFSWPAGCSDEDLVRLDLQACFKTRNLPLSTMGYGASKVEYKLAATIHIKCLETGTVASFQKVRREYYRWSISGFLRGIGAARERPRVLLQR